MPKDLAGNKLSTARLIGLGASFKDSVGRSDRSDFYQTILNKRSLSSFTLKSSGVVAINLLNSLGKVISQATTRGSSHQISKDLDPGRYYIRITSGSANAKYTLSTSAIGLPPKPMKPSPEPGSSVYTSYNTGELNGEKIYQDSVGGLDSKDYYRFTLSQMSEFKANLDFRGPSVYPILYYDQNNNGSIDYEIRGGDDQISTILAPGTYFLGLDTPYTEVSDYTLIISAIPTGDPSLVDPGNTPATASNLGLLTGAKTLNGFLGTGDEYDYYHFTLNRPTDVSVTYSGSALASIFYDSNGDGNLSSDNSYSDKSYPLNSHPFSKTLLPGNYFIPIFYNYKNSTYNLNIIAR